MGKTCGKQWVIWGFYSSSGQNVQPRSRGAVQLLLQCQLAGMAPPAEALQHSPLPQPTLHAALALIPSPLHQGAAANNAAAQRCIQLAPNRGRAQPITALPMELRLLRLIQNPGPTAPQDSVESWCDG